MLVFVSWQTVAVAQLLIPQAGQYGAGFELFNARPDETTEIRTAVWYPTVANATGNTSVYPWGDWRFESPFLGVTDSDEVPNDQQFPLVVLSHGWGAWGGSFAYLGESLASHGYVVAAPDHSTNDLSRRADELIHIVDTMLARSESAQDKLYGLVDADSIAFGGYSHGAATTPTALKKDAIDVDAVLLIDGAGAEWDFAGDAPVIHIGGGDIGFRQILSRIGSPEFYTIDIGAGSDEVRAHHWSFGVNGCQIREQVLSAGLAAGATEEEVLAAVRPDSFWLGCNPALIPPTEVQERMNVQVVGFLDSVLKHDGGLGDLLSPGKNTTAADLWLTV